MDLFQVSSSAGRNAPSKVNCNSRRCSAGNMSAKLVGRTEAPILPITLSSGKTARSGRINSSCDRSFRLTTTSRESSGLALISSTQCVQPRIDSPFTDRISSPGRSPPASARPPEITSAISAGISNWTMPRSAIGLGSVSPPSQFRTGICTSRTRPVSGEATVSLTKPVSPRRASN